MPPAEKIPTSQPADVAPYPPPAPPAPPTSNYSLRGRQYQYSHTKPPVVAPPPRNTKRPPRPASAARKKKGRNTAADASAESETAEPQPIQQLESTATHANDSAAGEIPPDQADSSSSLGAEKDGIATHNPTLPRIDEETHPGDQQEDPSELREMNSEMLPSSTAIVTTAPVLNATPARCPDIQIVQPTPKRASLHNDGDWASLTPSHSGLFTSASNASPLAFRTCSRPSWDMDFNDTHILNPSFKPNPSLPMPFPSAMHSTSAATLYSESGLGESTQTQDITNPDTMQEHLNTYDGSFGISAPSQPAHLPLPDWSRASSSLNPDVNTNPHLSSNPIANLGPPESQLSVSLNSNPQHSTSPAFSELQSSLPSSRRTTPQPRTTDLAALHSMVIQSLHPEPSLMPTVPTSEGNTLVPPTWCPGFAPALGANARAGSPFMGSRGPSPAPTLPAAYLTLPAPSSAATGITSRSPSPNFDQPGKPGQSQGGLASRALRRSNFDPTQYKIIQWMTHRWQWSILTEDAFPTNTTNTAEKCIAYAENVLSVSRFAENIGLAAWEYVRPKESRIRNDSQRGVLGLVEEQYCVAKNTNAKVKELISHSNFIYIGYDPTNLSKVSGRFKHPCINAVIKLIIFPPRSRGMPIGTRFIRELIAITPQDQLRDYVDKNANYGAPIPLIALACTLILHSLRLLELGYSSKDPKNKKMPCLDSATYSRPYNGFIDRLKKYDRLGELRRFHAGPLLTEFTKRYPHGATLEEDEENVERFSDGE